ncbi:FAS1 domain-containing protein [Coprinopsis marcescibilis]|uniref:FAS1 domain-containing protein n=1 Tax=Coprinopsis marcescibilis TaxID=230819 RepID=A0A5C3KIE1_COPMA|nr:FAS1 domain-containing protein [Coprinopsis marcescibilis]
MFLRPPRLLLLSTLIGSIASGWAHTLPQLIEAHDELSAFGTILGRFPDLLGNLTARGGTIFAPTNTAIRSFVSAEAGVDPEAIDLSSLTRELVSDFFSYHYLPLSLRAEDLSVRGGALVETSLLRERLANLDGTPNVVYASAYGSTGLEIAPSPLKIFSGVGQESNVTTTDLEIEGGGFVHIIDRVLNFPRTCTDTAETASLSTLLDALVRTNLTEVVDTTPKFTCFAPTDEAFRAAGIDLDALSTDQIADALKYHSIVGDIGYSTAFEDSQQYETLLGVNVTVHKREGQLFINDVAVERGNVIMTNGVAHVLSGVLVPPVSGSPSGTGGGDASGPGGSNTGAGAAPGPSSTRTADAPSALRVGKYALMSLIFATLVLV